MSHPFVPRPGRERRGLLAGIDLRLAFAEGLVFWATIAVVFLLFFVLGPDLVQGTHQTGASLP